MKTVLILAALCAVAFAQHDHDHGIAHGLIHKEVEALLAADPDITVEQCAAKCDAMFDLAVPEDEAATDVTCKAECHAIINHVDHTHPPHMPHDHHTTAPSA